MFSDTTSKLITNAPNDLVDSHVLQAVFIFVYITCSKNLTEETKYYCKCAR